MEDVKLVPLRREGSDGIDGRRRLWNPLHPFNVEKLPEHGADGRHRGDEESFPSVDRVGEGRQSWLQRASLSISTRIKSVRELKGPCIFDPGSHFIRQWTKVFVCSSLAAAFLDPLFFFLPIINVAGPCVDFDWNFAVTLTLFRSLTDLMYLLYVVIKFRTAYTAPSSLFGRGELVRDPKKIAWNYMTGSLVLDIIAMLPLPQIVLWVILAHWDDGSASTGNNSTYLRLIVAIQYIPRIIQVLPVQAAVIKPEGVVFETAWAGFVINLVMFLLAAHIVGSIWYVFGLERIDSCWQQFYCNTTCPEYHFSCGDSNILSQDAKDAIGTNCNNPQIFFGPSPSQFDYGIYAPLLLLIQTERGWQNYLYSFWWGLQQICSFGNNLNSSSFPGENILCIVIAVVGLVLFALLVGNIQTFLQSLSARLDEMRLQGRDTESWMKARKLDEGIRQRVRKHDRYTWEATSGVDEQGILKELPEDIRRDIKRHLCFDLVKKVHLFERLDEIALDEVCERLKPRLYIKDSDIFREGQPVKRMLFVVRGTLESITTNGGRSGFLNIGQLHPGDFAGEELLSWCLDSRSKDALPKSTRTITALTPVEAFYLDADALEYLTDHYFKRQRSKEFRDALRYNSHSFRTWAAQVIQFAWKRYKKRQAMRATQAALHESGTFSTGATSHVASLVHHEARSPATRRRSQQGGVLRKPTDFVS